MSLKKVLEAIKRNRKFLISAHVNLEGDALGSELALARLLRALQKTVYVVNQDKTPMVYKFLPGVKGILQPTKKNLDFEVALLIDCSDFNRIGRVKELIGKDKPIINIDHHISNTRFGKVNWVEPQASSASEMVYEIYKKGKFKIDRDTAVLLYVGILVDTGSFRYVNTTVHTHEVVADLLKHNLPVDKIYNQIYALIPLKEIKLLSRLSADFKIDKTGKIIWLSIGQGRLQENKMKTDVSEYLFNFLRSIEGIEVAIIFRELGKNRTRVNFRSNGRFDVCRLAEKFRGGGHKRASGCTINTDLKSARNEILSLIKRNL